MAKEEKNTVQAPAELPKIQRPTGLMNLMAKFPQYNGGDARVAKVGTKGAAVHGYLLGIVDLPKTIKDEVTGEMKDWTALVIELIQPAPADDPDGEEGDEPKLYVKGDKIVVTVSKVLERPEIRMVAQHPGAVFEVYFEPVVGKTRGGRSLWQYPVFDVGRPVKREARHQVGTAFLALAKQFEPSETPQLGAGPVTNTSTGSNVPSAHHAG